MEDSGPTDRTAASPSPPRATDPQTEEEQGPATRGSNEMALVEFFLHLSDLM